MTSAQGQDPISNATDAGFGCAWDSVMPLRHNTNTPDRLRDYLTLQELCQWLKIPKATIYDWTHSGFIPHYKLGRLLRFDSKEIEGWLKARKIPGRRSRIPAHPPRAHNPLDLG